MWCTVKRSSPGSVTLSGIDGHPPSREVSSRRMGHGNPGWQAGETPFREAIS
jgi:hypothetical protein